MNWVRAVLTSAGLERWSGESIWRWTKASIASSDTGTQMDRMPWVLRRLERRARPVERRRSTYPTWGLGGGMFLMRSRILDHLSRYTWAPPGKGGTVSRLSRGGNGRSAMTGLASRRAGESGTAVQQTGAEKPRRVVTPAGQFVYEIMDYEQIPFERLKPWFRASDVDEAIGLAVSLGLRELPGVLILREEEDAPF